MLNLQEKRGRQKDGWEVNKQSSIVLHKKSYIEGRKKQEKKKLEKLCNRQKTTKPERNFTSHANTHLLLTHTHTFTPGPGHTDISARTQHDHKHIYSWSGGRLEKTKVANNLPKKNHERDKRTRAQKASKTNKTKKCIYSLHTHSHKQNKKSLSRGPFCPDLPRFSPRDRRRRHNTFAR